MLQKFAMDVVNAFGRIERVVALAEIDMLRV